jgi:hypothetical protein
VNAKDYHLTFGFRFLDDGAVSITTYNTMRQETRFKTFHTFEDAVDDLHVLQGTAARARELIEENIP